MPSHACMERELVQADVRLECLHQLLGACCPGTLACAVLCASSVSQQSEQPGTCTLQLHAHPCWQPGAGIPSIAASSG